MLAFVDMQACAMNKLVILPDMLESRTCKARNSLRKLVAAVVTKYVAGSVQCVWHHECLCWWQNLPQVVR